MRRMTPRPPARGGFTLVELLIVVAIIATLAALAAFAFFRVKGSEQSRATDATIQKLNVGLDAKWKAVLDDAKDDLTKGNLATLVTWAGNDKDRALAIWSYLKLKNEFPTSIAEAASPVVLNYTDPMTGTTVQVVGPASSLQLPAKAVFRAPLKDTAQNAIPAGVLAKGATAARAPDESALFFQWGLGGSAIRGMTFGQDGTTNQKGKVEPPIPFVYGPGFSSSSTLAGESFKDSFGLPIAFSRLTYSPEINKPPYARKAAPRPLVADGSIVVVANDPLDPKGTLPTTYPAGSGKPWDQGKLKAFWAAATDGHLNYTWTLPVTPPLSPAPSPPTFPATVSGVGYPFDLYVDTTTGVTTLTPFNLVPTLIGAGDDKTYDATIVGGDDQLGFRLRREGNRGN